MFKFKSLITAKGCYCYNDRFVHYKNSEVITEDKDEAEYLRNNSAFIEIKEEMETEVVLEQEPKDEAEVEPEIDLEELKKEATELGLKFHCKIGLHKLKKMIMDFNNALNSDEVE